MHRRAPPEMLSVAAVLVLTSCQSAAEIFLDVEPVRAESPGGDQLQSAAWQLAFQADTIRPPIEEIADPDSVLTLLPKAADGAVDWMSAIRLGVIDPLSGRMDSGGGDTNGGFGYDFYFGDFETYFPHSSHQRWLACESCHPKLYRRRGHSTSMAEINAGESCGACHGPAAFPASACERCHPALSMPEGRLTPSLGPGYVFERSEEASLDVNTEQYPPAVFSHGRHRVRNTCVACHEGTFAIGPLPSGEVTMQSIQLGEACGACHNGETAFGILECARCHRPPESAEGGPSP